MFSAAWITLSAATIVKCFYRVGAVLQDAKKCESGSDLVSNIYAKS
jgi:hypothetical protein